MIETENLPYHDDGERLYYNTGNKINVEKRTRTCMAGAACEQIVDVPEDSLQGRFRYFKKRTPEPEFKNLQTPEFKDYKNYDEDFKSDLIDLSNAKLLQTDSGFLVCKNIFTKSALGKYIRNCKEN